MRSAETWSTYALRCREGDIGKHTLNNPTVRTLVIDQCEKVNKREHACGPHTIVESIVTQQRTDWGPMSGIDAQTADRKNYFKQVESVTCPACGALPKQPCENLRSRSIGLVENTAWPHEKRVNALRSRP